MDRPQTLPLRTVLFVAGSMEREVNATPDHGADAIVIDLEEPETPMSEGVRERARAIVEKFLRGVKVGPDPRPLYFARVQPAARGHMLRDLRAVMHPALAGILVPKIEGPRDIIAAEALLANMEVEAGLEPGSVLIYPILETAQAIRQAFEIAMASPRVGYMGGAISRFGDIHQAIGFRWTSEGRETLFLRSKVLADAKAAGIRYPISGMWGGDTNDLDGLRSFAGELRDLGYYGMMLGDPAHIETVHEIFTPKPEEVKYWRELVALAEEAERTGSGPILYGDPNRGEGHVVHIAHVGSARLNLEWAEALGIG